MRNSSAMQIKTARFLISNSDPRKCPAPDMPEYAFVGRSNVGKSSLINMLANNRNLAKTSLKPGKTQLINHFVINDSWYLVDLPGYGYARTSKTSRQSWGKMTNNYILQRENLVNVFVLVDSRIPPQNIDVEFINFLGGNSIPLTIVYTKIDKQRQRDVAHNINAMKKVLSETWAEIPEMILTSSVSQYGRERILYEIEELNKNFAEHEQKTDD